MPYIAALSNPYGKFVWYDLMTDDLVGATKFSGQVVGWQVLDAGMNDAVYKILSADTVHIGGIMPTPDDLL